MESYSGLISGALAAVIGLLIVTKLYSKSPFQRLSNNRPWFVWTPSYEGEFRRAVGSMTAEEKADLISRQLRISGFEVLEQNPNSIVYSRGHKYGDFSIKLAKVDLKIFLPIKEKTNFQIKYGWVCLFDTGDLWKLARELISDLEAS